MSKIVIAAVLLIVLSLVVGAASGQTEPEPPPIDVDDGAAFQLDPASSSANPIIVPASTTQGALTPIIVKLRPDRAYIPETRLFSTAAVQTQRMAIRTAQEDVLGALNLANAQVMSVQQYETLPYVALQVDAVGLAALQANPDVEAIYEDQINEILVSDAMPVIGAPTVWDTGYRGDGVAIAIIDTGVDSNHEVFTGGKVIQEACFGTNTGTGTFRSACSGELEELIGPSAAQPDDCNGCDHGTHVAGIAAGNNESVVGMGSPDLHLGAAPDASIIAVNAFSIRISNDTPGAFDSDVIAALEYVYRLATDGPDGNPDTDDAITIAAANMSLGAGGFVEVCDDGNQAYVDVVQQLADAGVATVSASGNQGLKDQLSKPACISNIYSVGAVTVEASDPTNLEGLDGTVAYFSNSNQYLDLLAPGFQINSSVPIGTGTGGGDFEYKSGTSMAAPIVSGAAAIMRQRYTDAPPSDIMDQFKQTGIPVTDNGQSSSFGSSAGNGLTHPLLQLDSAIDIQAPELILPSGDTVSTQPTFIWTDVPLAANYDVTVFDAADDSVVVAGNDIYPCAEGQCFITSSAPLEIDHTYYWTVVAKSANGVMSEEARGEFVIKGVLPSNETLDAAPSFFFQQEKDVTWYQLQVSTTGENSRLLIDEWYEAEDICDDEAVLCTIDPKITLAGLGDRSLRWRYRTYNAVTNVISETWNGYFDFTILAPKFAQPTADVVSDVGRPTFYLEPLTADGMTATWYRFYIAKQETLNLAADIWMPITDADCDEDVCAFTPDATLFNDDYVVYVNAYTVGLGFSAWSQPDEFVLDAPPPSADSIQLKNLYENEASGLTVTGFEPCEITGTGRPRCTTSLTYLEFDYNVDGFSGDWFEFVLWEPQGSRIIYRKWINLTEHEEHDEIECGFNLVPGAMTSTVPSCLLRSPYLADDTYQWYLRSWGPGGASTGGIANSGYTEPGGTSDLNDIAEFDVALPGPRVEELVAITEAGGTDDMTDTDAVEGEVLFTWKDIPSAEWYRLTVRDNANNEVHDEWYQRDVDIECPEGTCEILTDVTFLNGTYRWEIVYWNGEFGPTSLTTFPINLGRPVLTDVADMKALNNETVSGNTRPRFFWARMPNATWYDFELIDSEGETIFKEWYRARDWCGVDECLIWPNTVLEQGQYTWYIQPWGPGGFAGGDAAEQRLRLGPATFNMSATSTGTPLPLTPSDITVGTSTPEFYWLPAANGSWYNIQVINEETSVSVLDSWFFIPEWACLPDSTTIETCMAKPNVKMANNDSYIWRVRSYGPAGMGNWSNFARFGVSAPISQMATLISPTDNAVLLEDPEFVWTDVQADYYRLEVRDEDDNVVYNEWKLREDIDCEATFCTETLPEDIEISGEYTWSVSTWSAANGGVIQTSQTFTFVRL